MPIPAKTINYAFWDLDWDNCTLYVPKGTRDAYRTSGIWIYFKNIVEMESAGINSTATDTEIKEVSRFSADGQRIDAPVKGLNIVKFSDGTMKKFVVK